MDFDPEWHRFIQRWSPPAPRADLDCRMLSRYRSARGWRAKWNRFARARLAVPVPLLAAMLLVAAGLFFFSRSLARSQTRMGGFEPVAYPQLIVIRAETER